MEHTTFSVGNEGRQVFWNAEYFELILFLFTAVALVIFAYGVYRRWQMWKAMGKPEIRTDNMGERIKILLRDGLLQLKTFKDIYPGIMHAFIFFGFFVLIFGAAFDATEFHITEPLGWAFLRGNFYLVFSLLMDLFGLLVLIGVLMALDRRYLQKPDRLGYRGKPDNKPDDAIVLLLIGGIIITGFIIEALRLYVTNPSWGHWSFVGWIISKAFVGIDHGTARILHKVMWWTHTFIALGFIAYIPYSRLLHIITTSANYFMSTLKPVGYVEPIADFENAESFGMGQLEDFTWKQIFDSDACTRCGRCQDGCPAYLTGKPLSPKKLVQDLKTYWLERAPKVMAAKKAAGPEGEPEIPEPEKAMVGEVIDLHELWACTNCMYCMEVCPASIEHVPKIVGMRQYKVLMEADFAPELQLTYRNMENNSNPWGIGAHMRADWAKDLGIKTLAEDGNVEYLYYVGCAGSFDDRGKKVAIAFAKILKAAGINFGILGTEEGCCGDSAMRGGNEYLYQTLAQMNIEAMNGYGVKKIITTCPHGYNALKKDYPHFGGNFEVYHHTEIIADLIAKGRINLKKPVDGVFTYHDSCFLGRYNQIYDQPRNVLKAVPGLKLTEMKNNHTKSFCCGAGGARMWMEEDIGERINDVRTDQAIEAKADHIAVGCPFCLTMMVDGIKDREMSEKMDAADIAEIVWKAMGIEEAQPEPEGESKEEEKGGEAAS
ncbi:MAG: (Fe-S)-binding protein [Deltaproteobacteria bacterium]|nr:(Fe-S)-binding protein [Deltaproteobacteria bacterium]